MGWFSKKEKRELEAPHKEQDTSVCAEVNQGVGLISKLLKLNGYGALSQSPFFAGINLIANGVAQMSWEVKSKKDIDVPSDIYVNHLFDECKLTQFMLVKNLIKDVLLHGNGFAYIHRDKKGIPISLEYLPFGDCNIVYNKANNTLFYQVPRISRSLIEPINIIHVLMHSKNGIEGCSILDFASNTINLNANAEKAASTYFGSGMTVQGILSTESPRLTKEQRENIRSAWQESQVGNGQGIAVLEAGMKYQPISSNSKDAQLLETRLFNITEVARWLNISPVLLGDYSKTAYNTIEQCQLQFVVNTLSPYVLMLEQELNRKIIMPNDRNKYYIDILEESIIAQDKKAQAEYLGTLIDKAIITPNEARMKLGYAPVEGGDELYRPFTDINQNKLNQDKNTDENKDEKQ